MSARFENSTASVSVSPKPRVSWRMTRYASFSASTWPSHMLRFAMPAWTSSDRLAAAVDVVRDPRAIGLDDSVMDR